MQPIIASDFGDLNAIRVLETINNTTIICSNGDATKLEMEAVLLLYEWTPLRSHTYRGEVIDMDLLEPKTYVCHEDLQAERAQNFWISC